ncbi:MAG: hybrid sensor histidine kinase/response regulator [Proteobacteria bacterium]|nr:hybrid sensor histidine kinase/response regulator [Pseudomonadota bacterium]MBU1715479.1 hybrid sensor histidine kinase/response regulator [Pseudomonadota bacterium]
MAFDLTKFIGRFVEEAREHVTTLNKGMLELEKGTGNAETINLIFRAAHTIKGSSRMLKLIQISELAHQVEDAFGALREGKIKFSDELKNVLYKGIDAIAALIEKAANGESIDQDQTQLLKMLGDAAEGKALDTAGEPPDPDQESVDSAEQERPKPAAKKMIPAPSKEATPPPKPESQPPPEPVKNVKAQESIRVNTEKLSELIRLASEITSRHSRTKQRCQEIHTLAKQIKQIAATVSSSNHDEQTFNQKLEQTLHQIAKNLNTAGNVLKDDYVLQDLLIRGLQERSLKLRMLPLATIFDTFQRTVREIAGAFGKEIKLEIIGDEIEMDKKIIEKLGDPLVHMFRNAIDHGIEAPDQRKKAGKPGQGKIKLTACYEGGKVLIVLQDDGHGLSLEKIKQKALSNGLATQENLNNMSVAEIQNLIFTPGFSTCEIITDISGRGVGMDVVKKNIVDDLKGSINIESTEGKGTTFKVRLPMTLAIMHVVIVEVGNTMFALPDNYIGEIIKVREEEIIDVFDKRAVNIRDQLIPVENLQTILGLPENNISPNQELLMLIVKIGAERLGLVVNAILDEEDMVIKSLPAHMKNNKMVSGVIITGRDQVVNVLNVPSVFLAAKETKGSLARKAGLETDRQINILVVDDSINTREIEKSILEAYGYHVTLAGDGIEALEKARENKYDIIITDVEMPRMDGFTLTETLRADKDYKNTPIMLLTSRDKDEDKRRGIQVGANAYILKGDFEQSNLISTIENLV